MKKFKIELNGAFENEEALVEKTKEVNNFLKDYFNDLKEFITDTVELPDGVGVDLTFTEACYDIEELREMYMSRNKFFDSDTALMRLRFTKDGVTVNDGVHMFFNSEAEMKIKHGSILSQKCAFEIIEVAMEYMNEMYEKVSNLWRCLDSKREMFIQSQLSGTPRFSMCGVDISDLM